MPEEEEEERKFFRTLSDDFYSGCQSETSSLITATINLFPLK